MIQEYPCSALISNYMYLTQVFQIEKDIKITRSPSNNKDPNLVENKKLENNVS